MKEQIEQVREFMRAFGQGCPEAPILPCEPVRELREILNNEENGELYEAETETQALDAIADLLYVVMGASIAYGFSPTQSEAAFAEVHRSNMTKFWSEEEVKSYCEQFVGKEDSNPLTFTRIPDGRFRATNKAGKVIKSPSYSPANLGPIVEGGKA